MIRSADCLIWQTLASVLIPGFTIHKVVKYAKMGIDSPALGKTLFKNSTMRKFGPTLIGLGAIPFIIHPIDNAVDYLMDNTYRKLLFK